MRFDESDSGPLEVRLDEGNKTDEGYWVREGPMRGLFRQRFDAGALYCFMRTFANSAAVDELKKPEHKQRFAGFRGIPADGDFSVSFDRKVMQCYFDAIYGFAQKALLWYARYPLLNAGNLAEREFHPDEVLMPVVHVVKGELGFRKLKDFVTKLQDDSVWDYLVEKQGSDKFQLYELTVLRSMRIPPLIIGEREMKLEGRQLRNFIDFLEPLEYVGKENPGSVQ